MASQRRLHITFTHCFQLKSTPTILKISTAKVYGASDHPFIFFYHIQVLLRQKFYNKGISQPQRWRKIMWNTPKVTEVSVGLEINSYACAEV